LALLHPRDDFYAAGHPTPEVIFLAIEVADTSVEYDRQVKTPLYAHGGIPELWLVGLQQDHTD
jgi:Uma2 family endonuclease